MYWNLVLPPTAPHSIHSKPLLAFCHVYCLSVYSKGCLPQNLGTKSPLLYIAFMYSCSEDYLTRVNCILDGIFFSMWLKIHWSDRKFTHCVVLWCGYGKMTPSCAWGESIELFIFSPMAFEFNVDFYRRELTKKLSSLCPWNLRSCITTFGKNSQKCVFSLCSVGCDLCGFSWKCRVVVCFLYILVYSKKYNL